MNQEKKIILIPILIPIFTLVFTVLNSGLKVNQLNQIIQPLAFALSATSCILFPNIRTNLIKGSLYILLSMVLVYLFNMLDIANWLGSLGFGVLFITIISYLPQLVKRGSIEKF